MNSEHLALVTWGHFLFCCHQALKSVSVVGSAAAAESNEESSVLDFEVAYCLEFDHTSGVEFESRNSLR
jgi:hypothetical protein